MDKISPISLCRVFPIVTPFSAPPAQAEVNDIDDMDARPHPKPRRFAQ